MSRRSQGRPGPGAWIGVGAGVLAVVAVVIAVVMLQRLPDGPVPIAWDQEACAHCHMHVGDPHFAAQLQLADGRVLNFDDPGCALHYLARVRPEEVHALWFHALRDDRWLRRAEVAFVEVNPTPMGWGLGAVPAGTPGALSFDEARQRLERRGAAHGERTSWR